MLKKPNGIEQHARFIETARALGCDEDEAAFDEKLRTLARPKLPSAKDQVAKAGNKGNKRRATDEAAD